MSDPCFGASWPIPDIDDAIPNWTVTDVTDTDRSTIVELEHDTTDATCTLTADATRADLNYELQLFRPDGETITDKRDFADDLVHTATRVLRAYHLGHDAAPPTQPASKQPP